MRKFTIMTAAALAVGAINLGIAAVPAGAVAARGTVAARHPSRAIVPSWTNRQDVELCDSEANALCMNGFDGNGGTVKGDPFTSGNAQDVSVTQLSNCGGVVTTSPTACPFTSTDLDIAYSGDTIVGITNDANSMAYRDNGSNGLVEGTAGNGQVWVVVGELTGVNSGATFINVSETNVANVASYACTNGSGRQIVESTNFVSDTCTWFASSGS